MLSSSILVFFMFFVIFLLFQYVILCMTIYHVPFVVLFLPFLLKICWNPNLPQGVYASMSMRTHSLNGYGSSFGLFSRNLV